MIETLQTVALLLNAGSLLWIVFVMWRGFASVDDRLTRIEIERSEPAPAPAPQQGAA